MDTLDQSTNAKLLLSMSYDDLVSFAASNVTYQNIINNDNFWKLKLEQDYNRKYRTKSKKSAREQYFEQYDLIRVETKDADEITDEFFNKLVALERNSNNKPLLHFSGEFDSNQSKFEQ
jgi:hypothetical protein